MSDPAKLIFLPGASGIAEFWLPLAAHMQHHALRRFISYPGFGNAPADPAVSGIDDLVARVVHEIDQPCALIAQSMGGILAVRAASEKTGLVTHLVLCATSGGVDMDAFHAQDWRAGFAAANPHLPDWFVAHKSDLSTVLQRLDVPVLLLWGDADPISPPAVGRHLHSLLPQSRLHIVSGGEHDLARVHAEELAPLIDQHLQPSI